MLNTDYNSICFDMPIVDNIIQILGNLGRNMFIPPLLLTLYFTNLCAMETIKYNDNTSSYWVCMFETNYIFLELIFSYVNSRIIPARTSVFVICIQF